MSELVRYSTGCGTQRILVQDRASRMHCITRRWLLPRLWIIITRCRFGPGLADQACLGIAVVELATRFAILLIPFLLCRVRFVRNAGVTPCQLDEMEHEILLRILGILATGSG